MTESELVKQATEQMAVNAAKQRYMHLQNKSRLTGEERVEMRTLHKVLSQRYLKQGKH